MIMEKDNYIAELTYDPDQNIYHGRVINTDDIITFEGRSTDELEAEFEKSIQFYLNWQSEDSFEPNQPCPDHLNLRPHQR